MQSLSLLLVLISVFCSSPRVLVSATSLARHPEAALKSYYSSAHSLEEGYVFDSREWQTVNVTNLDYKYAEPMHRKRASSSNTAENGGAVSHLINDVWNGLKGIGSSLDVKITWFAQGSLFYARTTNC